tara:strand:+ start:68 stop:853 length:786 start_codon:yes stop_codon:yes gene_type:complete
MGRKRSYKYAVKRPTIKKKDIGRGLKAIARGGIKGRDILRAGKKLKKKYGGFPRIPGIMRGRPGSPDRGPMKRRAGLYKRLDGGTEDTMYIKGPAPGGRSKSNRKSKKRDDRSRSMSRSSSGSSRERTMQSSVGEYQPFDFSQMTAAYDQQIQNLNNQIAGMTANFQNQAAQMQQQMAAERAETAQRMQEQQNMFGQRMQEQQNMFGQQMAAASPRDRVQGIRFSDYGTGGATQAQLARQGTSGTFGRTGDRLMKISSLNV